MDQQQPVVPEPSPMKNFVGGGGCFGGCLGALVVAVGAILLLGIPLEFYEGETNGVVIAAVAAFVIGLVVGLVGVAMWIGSIFME